MKEAYDIKGSIVHIDTKIQGGSVVLVKEEKIGKGRIEGKKMTLYRIVFLLLKCLAKGQQFTHGDVMDLLSCGRRQAIAYIRLAEQLGYVHRVRARPALYRVIKVPRSIEEMYKKLEKIKEVQDEGKKREKRIEN